MPPTVYISEFEDKDEGCENQKGYIPSRIISDKLKTSTDAENENVGRRVKRKSNNSQVNDSSGGSSSSSSKRMKVSSPDLNSSSSSCSSLDDNDSNNDDYGTDTELIEIDKNKHKISTNRYTQMNVNYGSHRINSSERVQTIINTTAFVGESNMCHSIDEESSHLEDVVKKFTCTKISNANTRLLLEIAISTFSLAKRNREFQEMLQELQKDTKKLVESVLENPENEGVKNKLQYAI